MQANTGMWFNQYTTQAGDYFTIQKVYKAAYEGERKRYLIRFTTGAAKGIDVNTSSLPIKKKTEFNPLSFFQVCLTEYVNAGWDANRINKAGLCPKEYRPYLSQWIRNIEYFNK